MTALSDQAIGVVVSRRERHLLLADSNIKNTSPPTPHQGDLAMAFIRLIDRPPVRIALTRDNGWRATLSAFA